MKKFTGLFTALLTVGLFLQATPTILAQGSSLNADVLAKIRKEGNENSQIMNSLHYLTDVYGPRLTGSPNLENAGKWAMKRMKGWGFDKTAMEPWDFKAPGWANQRASGFIISPVQDSLTFEVLGWTPGTNGTVTGNAIKIDIPTKQLGDNPRCVRGPSQSELDKYLASIQSQIAGNMVMIGKPRKLPVNFGPQATRIKDDGSGGFSFNRPRRPNCPKPEVRPLGRRQMGRLIGQFLVDNKAAVRVNDARMLHGMVRAFGNRFADPAKTLPTVVMRNEDYGRIWRLLGTQGTVKLEFNIKNTYYPKGKTAYNTIGEIWGTDKKDEVIMLGGHMDSWHAATGATDNGINVAVMMEAARILKAIGVKPRRTVRVALWAGEEQGLLGSQAYVKQHFGTFENPKPEYHKFGGYFNIDSGTGRVRRFGVFGPAAAGTILSSVINSSNGFTKFLGSSASKSRRLGGTDSTSFNAAGLPGIGGGQDPIEYFNRTWHTNLDTYERIIEEDVKANAIMIASAVYELAMRDELLPRFSKANMPSPPTPRPRRR